MARRPRTFPPNALLHVVNRGVERRQLFASPRDYGRFLRLLDLALSDSAVALLAYALMPNHWHLVVQAPSGPHLSQFMHRVTWRHAAVFRKTTGSAGFGHVYQGRYRAHVLESERRYLVALRYVEANPVRAGLVQRAEEWRWSSLFERLHARRRLADGPVPLPAPKDWAAVVNGVDRSSLLPEAEDDEVWP